MAKKDEVKNIASNLPAMNVAKYSIDELMEGHKQVEADKTIIKVALKKTGKKSFTLDEAKKIVTTFKEKEVK